MARAPGMAVAILALIAGAYWKLALPHPTTVWFDHYDMCQLEIPRLQFLARNLHAGAFPLWDPHTWAGLPVLGSAQPGPVYPLNLLFALAPLENGLLSIATLNWLFIAMHFLAAGFFYLFCRDQGLHRAAGLFGAIAFSCGGYFGSMPWLDVTNGASWTPLVFLFAFRIWSGRRLAQSAVLLGLALGISWLSGHHEIPLMNSYAVLLGGVGLFVSRLVRRRSADTPLVAATAGALLLAVAISAVQTLPMYEFGRHARRWVGAAEPLAWNQTVPYEVHATYSLPWSGLAGFLAPQATPEAHTTAFAGFAVMALAGIALITARRAFAVRCLAVLAVCGVIYALGAHTPLHRIGYYVLPMLEKARTPVRALYLVSFALAGLSAWGAHCLLQRKAQGRVALTVLGCVAVAMAAAGGIAGPHLSKALAAAAALGVIAVWRVPGVAAGGILLGVALLETSTVTALRMAPFGASSVCATSLYRYGALVDELRRDQPVGRIVLDWNELMTNLGDLYGVRQLQSFVAGVPANLLRLELHTAPVQRLLGVTHRVSKSGFTRQPGALPPAWVVHRTVTVRDEAALRRVLQEPEGRVQDTAPVWPGAPGVEFCSGEDPVRLVHRETDRVSMEATLPCRGILVLADTNYPGWEATVDGRPTTIVEMYGALRGVALAAGHHTVEFRYRPAVVWIGLGLTLLGLSSAMLMLWRDRSAASGDQQLTPPDFDRLER